MLLLYVLAVMAVIMATGRYWNPVFPVFGFVFQVKCMRQFLVKHGILGALCKLSLPISFVFHPLSVPNPHNLCSFDQIATNSRSPLDTDVIYAHTP